MKTTFVVTIDHSGETIDAFDELFAQYLTNDEYPFLSDYCHRAWGGYDDPIVRGVVVSSYRHAKRWEWHEEVLPTNWRRLPTTDLDNTFLRLGVGHRQYEDVERELDARSASEQDRRVAQMLGNDGPDGQ